MVTMTTMAIQIFIAKANDALVISTAEIAGKAAAAGCRTHAMHLGGKFDFEFGSVRIVPAFHGAGYPWWSCSRLYRRFLWRLLYTLQVIQHSLAI